MQSSLTLGRTRSISSTELLSVLPCNNVFNIKTSEHLMYCYVTKRNKISRLAYHSVQDQSCLHLPSCTSGPVVRRVLIVGGLDVGIVSFGPLQPQPAPCHMLVPSLVPPKLIVHVWLIVAIHVVVHLLRFLNVGLVVPLLVKNLLVPLTIQPACMSLLH